MVEGKLRKPSQIAPGALGNALIGLKVAATDLDVGLSDVYGVAVTLIPLERTSILPCNLGVEGDDGMVPGVGESVTVRARYTLDDASVVDQEILINATNWQEFRDVITGASTDGTVFTNLVQVLTNGRRIVKIVMQAKTDQIATTVIPFFQFAGFEY